MKVLKVLLNSLLCGLFFSILISLLILDLNINLDLTALTFIKLVFFNFITYGLFISFLCFLIFFIVQFFLGIDIKISLLSPPFLILSFSLLLFLFLIIFKANIDFFDSFFDSKTQSLITSQFTAFLFLSILGLFVFYSRRITQKNSLFIWLYFIFFVLALISSIYQRISFPSLQDPTRTSSFEAKNIDKKITIIGLEGLSFDLMIPLIDEDKLPNFSWLMEEGSWGRLKNFSPCSSAVLNNSFNTGKLPSKHRQLSSFKYSLLHFDLEIEVAPRFILFWQLNKIGLLRVLPNDTQLFSKDIWEIMKDNRTSYIKRDQPYFLTFDQPPPRTESLFNSFYKDLELESGYIFNVVRQAFFADAEYEDNVSEEKNQSQPQLVYFLMNGLNLVEAYFYKYSRPDLFGNISQERLNKYGSVIEKYYQFYDQIIGKYLTSLKEEELLVVYSSHGIEPLPLWKRFVESILGDANISAHHDNAPEGVFFFYGKHISHGKHIESMRIIDMIPTLLNYLGLPVGKDMDGIVNSSLFNEDFKIENPVLYITSYEGIDIK